MENEILQPADWARPRGYVNAIAGRGRMVFISGQIGWDAQCRFTSDRFADQVRQALANIVAVLAVAGGRPEDLVRLTWYVTSRDEYYASLPELGAAYRDVLGRVYPTMAVVQVVALMERDAKVEIEATAVIPQTRPQG